jgi:hypothetical protein
LAGRFSLQNIGDWEQCDWKQKKRPICWVALLSLYRLEAVMGGLRQLDYPALTISASKKIQCDCEKTSAM